MNNANKCAFPWVEGSAEGLSKREWLVGMALQGLCAAGRTALSDIPDKAIQLADATLAELEKTK